MQVQSTETFAIFPDDYCQIQKEKKQGSLKRIPAEVPSIVHKHGPLIHPSVQQALTCTSTCSIVRHPIHHTISYESFFEKNFASLLTYILYLMVIMQAVAVIVYHSAVVV